MRNKFEMRSRSAPLSRFVANGFIPLLVILLFVMTILAAGWVSQNPVPMCTGCGATATGSPGHWTIVHKPGCPYGPKEEPPVRPPVPPTPPSPPPNKPGDETKRPPATDDVHGKPVTSTNSFERDNKDLAKRLKSGTTTNSFDGDNKDLTGRLKPGTTTSTAAKPTDWSSKCSLWIDELNHVNKQVAVTRSTLLRLNELILADRKLFAEWEKEADEGLNRCVDQAIDALIDASGGYLADRYETILGLARKLPSKPEAVIEKYRHMASLFKILQEAKATKDLDGLAAREGKTDAEIFEMFRDGIGQIADLVGLDKWFPARVWYYGSLAADWAYNLAELRLVWKNVSALEANNAKYAESVMVLSNRMRELQERQAQLVKNIEAGEPRKRGAKSE